MSVAATAPRASASVPGAPPRENLYRVTQDIGLARTADREMPSLVGHFAVWDQWTEIRTAYEGHFMERFSPRSMTKTLTESAPKVLFQHGKDPQIGDKVLGPIRSLAVDDTGAAYDVALLDTSYNRDLIPGIEAGLYGASFRFKVVKEDFNKRPGASQWNPRAIPERTVLEAQVMEFGPVTFPAYAGATAGLRSMTDEFLLATLAGNEDLQRRTGISLAGVFDRVDASDICCLTQMIGLGAYYIAEQDESDDASDITAMSGVLHTLTKLLDGEIDETEPAEPDDMPMDGMYSVQLPPGIMLATTTTNSANGVTLNFVPERATWSAAEIDDLPDSAFLYVEDGGKKDGDGKTTPRSLRHFPVKDATGNVDLPHLRNALARIPQSDLPQSVKDDATAKAEKMLAAENGRTLEPDATGRTTPLEPEPPEATTHSDNHDLFWFVDTPSHLRERNDGND